MPTVKKITPTKCVKWVYGPQVSSENSNYAVGGTGKWMETMSQCDVKSLYSDVLPENLIDSIYEPANVINKIVIDYLDKSDTILPILLIHSAFINALGILEFGKRTGYNVLKGLLNSAYLIFYQKTLSLLKNKDHISIFVEPNTFLKLVLQNTQRPKNIVLLNDSKSVLNDLVSVYAITHDDPYNPYHPIPLTHRKCNLEPNYLCGKPFENIKNTDFKPVSDLITCYCTYLTKDQQVLTTREKILFKEVFFTGTTHFDPMIIVRTPKTYLSQLFHYTCIHLYRPPIVNPKSNTVDDIIFAAKQNSDMTKTLIFSYSPMFFTTKFITSANVSTLPVYFIEKNADGREFINFNGSLTSTVEFLNNVVNDFIELGVFKSMGSRYELNTEFDIELLECFRLLPNNEIKTSIKNNIIPHFYAFVGNVIILAITNGIKLPFNLSIFYIIRVFDLFDLQSIATKIDEKILLCSIYLNEKASSTFKKEVISMMENPEYAKGLKMNRTLRILEDDRQIYHEDVNIFVQNVIDYIYMNAYKHYMEVIPTDIPISSDEFKPNNNLKAFLFGLKYIKSFNSETAAVTSQIPLKKHGSTFNMLLDIVGKVTLFMDNERK
jgi:hypothetical protein